MSFLVNIITSNEPEIRNQSIQDYCVKASSSQLLVECNLLEKFRKTSLNLYEKVRSLFFLYTIHRFYLPYCSEARSEAIIPYEAYDHILSRRFEEAIKMLLEVQNIKGVNEGLSSALADAYHKLGFQTLANQVKKSVKTTIGNNWMFRISHPYDHPLRIRKELLAKDSTYNIFPILTESTPVRMDLSHSCWSDIFFLGMDCPKGARVLNISVDLCISGNSNTPLPPIKTFLRVIDEPVIRLISTDLEAVSEIKTISEIFDFAKDYLGLLKAALIASGIVPPAMEGAQMPLSSILDRMIGPGLGIEIISQVNNIPKGSRLAVSTNLLASLIALCMRATNQTESLDGILQENERRLVASKAILGEWLGGSGGGWQDSGGVWPGIKVIEGVEAEEKDQEYGISNGCLLPKHTILTKNDVSDETRENLQNSLVMVHGGMAQDVGPILEMVTEKYLLRSPKEWEARKKAIHYFDEVEEALKQGNIKKLGELTQQNFDGPIQEIIPWASNAYTERIISETQKEYKECFWGFWMMGGMSGGGMGFIFDPKVKEEAKIWLLKTMIGIKREMEKAIPFAMDPVVYDFKINEYGSKAEFCSGGKALLPLKYYSMVLPGVLKRETSKLTSCQRDEINFISHYHKIEGSYYNFVVNLFDQIIPSTTVPNETELQLPQLLIQNGFNPYLHEEIKGELKAGRIGLAQNRLPISTTIDDPVKEGISIINSTDEIGECKLIGQKALQNGELAIVTLAGGIGSRWTKGAGVVKSLHPFARFSGEHRNFLDIHLAKNHKTSFECNTTIPHVFTTSYLTQRSISAYVNTLKNSSNVFLSKGQFIGQRFYPTTRDLRFYWDEMPQQILDQQAQKVKESLHQALIEWTKQNGEGEDYSDNLPMQCIHPVGHWFEIPNMLLNGTLHKLINDFPNLKYLFVHNIDTLGANADPELLGKHILHKNDISVEVISRWLNDRGGGLAKINGRLKLIEGLAFPNEKIEFDLSYYNSNTFWISIDSLLKTFGLSKNNLEDKTNVKNAIVDVAEKMPSYITLKEVKKRWGKGQEDIYPVAQFEKLWGDMTALDSIKTSYFKVSRNRGQQLKEVAELDSWLNDGSAKYVNSICKWD